MHKNRFHRNFAATKKIFIHDTKKIFIQAACYALVQRCSVISQCLWGHAVCVKLPPTKKN